MNPYENPRTAVLQLSANALNGAIGIKESLKHIANIQTRAEIEQLTREIEQAGKRLEKIGMEEL